MPRFTSPDPHSDHDLSDVAETEQAAAPPAAPVPPTRPAAPPVQVPVAPVDPRAFTADDVAEQLGLHRSEVLELVRTGQLPAKRVGSKTFITAANLAAFLSRTDRRAATPRFEAGQVVVYMEDTGRFGLGRFVCENADGTFTVLCSGLFGEYQRAFPASQVQAFTCQVDPSRKQ